MTQQYTRSCFLHYLIIHHLLFSLPSEDVDIKSLWQNKLPLNKALWYLLIAISLSWFTLTLQQQRLAIHSVTFRLLVLLPTNHLFLLYLRNTVPTSNIRLTLSRLFQIVRDEVSYMLMSSILNHLHKAHSCSQGVPTWSRRAGGANQAIPAYPFYQLRFDARKPSSFLSQEGLEPFGSCQPRHNDA